MYETTCTPQVASPLVVPQVATPPLGLMVLGSISNTLHPPVLTRDVQSASDGSFFGFHDGFPSQESFHWRSLVLHQKFAGGCYPKGEMTHPPCMGL